MPLTKKGNTQAEKTDLLNREVNYKNISIASYGAGVISTALIFAGIGVAHGIMESIRQFSIAKTTNQVLLCLIIAPIFTLLQALLGAFGGAVAGAVSIGPALLLLGLLLGFIYQRCFLAQAAK